ncbi:MAG: RNA polymerase sigma factor [Clostridiaceae bacterium]
MNLSEKTEKLDNSIYENLKLAKSGDKDAFVAVMESYKFQLYRIGRTLLSNEEDIGDAMQETVLKTFKGIASISKLESFKSWIFKIMINECNNILRSKKKLNIFTKLFKEESYVDDYNFENEPVMKGIKSLKEDFKKVIILYYYEDLSVKDIAEILEISEGTVKSRLSRARGKLSEILKNGGM